MKFFLIVTLFVYSVNMCISAIDISYIVRPLTFVNKIDALNTTIHIEYISDDLEPLTDEIVNTVNALKLKWKAGKNFNGSSSIQMVKLIATQEKIPDLRKVLRNFVHYEYPFQIRSFDARKAWPNCTSIGKIYDQRKGYPSWIYTAVGLLADQLCIKTGVQIDVESTVEKMIRSSDISIEYNSASISQALSYWSKTGIFTVESVQDSICLPHSRKCQNGIKLIKYFKVTNKYYKHSLDAMSDLIDNGPISAYMRVYSDFPSYRSGVYMRTSKKVLGVQNVKIIGYGTEKSENYWLAAGSWGTGWGDKGFFKIERDPRQFGASPYAICTMLEPVDDLRDVPKSFDYDQLFYLAK